MSDFLVFAMLAFTLVTLANSIPFKDYCAIDKPCMENEFCENLKSGFECKENPEDDRSEEIGCPTPKRLVKKVKLIFDGALASELHNLIDKILSHKDVYDRSSNLLSVKLKLNNDDLK